MRPAALLVLVALAGCEPGDMLQRMTNQHKAAAFTGSTFFANGASMQTPPAGTVAQESIQDDARPPLTRALLERGRDRYGISCAPCHGLVGDAKTLIADRMKLRRPRSLHDPEVRAKSPDELYDVVTRGFGFMPSYARELSPRDRWAVVAYVKTLELSQSIGLDDLPTPLRAEALTEIARQRAARSGP